MVIFGERRRRRRVDARLVASTRGPAPDLPASPGSVDTWDIQRAVSFALDRRRRGPRRCSRAELRERVRRCSTSRPRCGWIHAPGRLAAGRRGRASGSASRRRWSPSSCSHGAAGARPRARAPARAPGRGGAAGGLRRAAAVRADRRASARSAQQLEADLARAAPDAPAAPGRGRLRQDAWSRSARCSGSSTPAARRRCSPRPRCSPSSTTARSPRCSATSPGGGMLGGADEGTSVALLTGSMTRAQRAGGAARIASGEAGIVIGTHALLEEQVTFADLGLVVVDEQHRFGVEQRAALTDKAGHAAARAGDDRDPDPAHRRDDGLRRPRGLDAGRAAGRPGARSRPTSCRSPTSRTGSTGSGSGSARRSARATRSTSSARGSPATSRSRARPTSATSTRRATTAPPPAALAAVEELAPSSPRARSPGCGSACCTAGCRRREGPRRCGPSPPATSTCWSPPP